MPEFWRDSVTDPPKEEEYPTGTRLSAVQARVGGSRIPLVAWAHAVRAVPHVYPMWAPLPTDPPVPDSELIVPKRCYESGWPCFIGRRSCVTPDGSHRFAPNPNATVSLDKAPPFDPWKVAARHPMELLEDGHEEWVVMFDELDRYLAVATRTYRENDRGHYRSKWCPLEPLLALLDKEGEG